MKMGLSTYCLSRAIAAGEMTPVEAIQWIAANGGEHVEISTVGFRLADEPDMAEAMRETAAQTGLEISSYTIGANFLQPTREAFDAEIERLLGEVDMAVRLGTRRMRHDVASRPLAEATLEQLAEDLPCLVEACRTIADYAARFGITTSLENHGFHLQHSERVQWLVRAVDRPNFRQTLDVGNFWCVDEDPLAAVRRSLPNVSIIHLKDFYRRSPFACPGEGWFQTAGGYYLRGAIVGQGDLDLPGILRAVQESGYDGIFSIEFEGWEECRQGARLGMENARRLWDAIAAGNPSSRIGR